jgi:hypothetical protein
VEQGGARWEKKKEKSEPDGHHFFYQEKSEPDENCF